MEHEAEGREEEQTRHTPNGRIAAQRRYDVALGLAIGDSLGATAEFQNPWEVGQNCVAVYTGWPGKLVGGGVADWHPGAPTDDTDMAMAILRAVASEKGVFSAGEIARNFLAWLETCPKDVGETTRRTLLMCQKGRKEDVVGDDHTSTDPSGGKKPLDPYVGGEWDFRRYPRNAANGSLMRNGMVAALFADDGDEALTRLLDYTVLHGIITHYAPLPVLTCVLQSLLIREALLKEARGEAQEAPTLTHLEELLNGPWKAWRSQTTDAAARKWLQTVSEENILKAEKQLLSELQGFEIFQPYTQDYSDRLAYCVLTLKIALWALHWSFQTSHPTIPDWLPSWPFQQHGFDTVMWVVLIGADADTYAAAAGPLLAAYYPEIKEQFHDGLLVKPLLQKYLAEVAEHLYP